MAKAVLRVPEGTEHMTVHTTTGEETYFASSSRPPLQVGVHLPEIEGLEEGIAETHVILKETHEKMAVKFRAVANPGRRNKRVGKRYLGFVVFICHSIKINYVKFSNNFNSILEILIHSPYYEISILGSFNLHLHVRLLSSFISQYGEKKTMFCSP